MYEIINRFMEKLTIEDVNNFALKNNVSLSNDELLFTYQFVKKNWESILANPNQLKLERYKSKFSEENFQKIQTLIKLYYQKYGHYL